MLPRQIQNFRRTRDRRLPLVRPREPSPLKVSILRADTFSKTVCSAGPPLLYDFIDDFAHQLAELPDEDAMQHYRRLPE